MGDHQKTTGRMLAFHGGKRGEGKSLLAQNLAAALADQGRQRVLLVDLQGACRQEYQTRWDLPAGPTLADLAGQLSRFDENTIHGYFPKSRCGVEVAVFAGSPEPAQTVTQAQLLHALDLFRRAFTAVVVDGLSGWDALTLSVLDAADRILLVCAPDLVGLKRQREDCLRYQDFKFPAAKIGLILNRADVPQGLTPCDLERALPGHTVLGSIPFDIRATASVNTQQDLVSAFPRQAFAKAMQDLGFNLMKDFAVRPPQPRLSGETGQPATVAAAVDVKSIKERIHQCLLEHPELKALAGDPIRGTAGQALLREKVEEVVTGLIAREAPELSERAQREQWVREIVDEALGLGPLEDLIRDPEISEIMVNERGQIYIERQGRLSRVAKHFVSDQQLLTVIERIVAPLGRRIDESQPYVDARLADGSRVNAIIPPLALKGPCLTIRKFSKQRLDLQALIRLGSLTADMAAFLGACVTGRKNILISGGTGSGKTTLLNVIAACIPAEERIITVEDAAELNLPQPHVVTLESRPSNIEGKGAVTIRDLVRNCLRMRPDRIVVGECRGGEALDMLQAMNTGHDGSLTTVHANSPKDAIARLETMVLMSGMELPVRAIREQIAGAVNLIIQQSRLQDGSRKLVRIAEVAGAEEGIIILKDIFTFHQAGLDQDGKVLGEFKATGYVPACVQSLRARGLEIDERLFEAGKSCSC